MVRVLVAWFALGWSCASCTLINEPEDHDLCPEHGMQCDPIPSECNNSPGGSSCTCPAGYDPRNGGRQCVDIDECRSGTHDCDTATQDCKNVPGDYRCECKDGFARNEDGSCGDIDECAESPPRCEAPQKCQNLPGTFHCDCPSPARMNGMACEAVDPCATDQHACAEGTECVSLDNGGYRCDCRPGYARLSGSRRCEDVDECQDEPCPDGATCHNLDGDYECTCRAYYETSPDGSECRDERLSWSKLLAGTDNVQPLVDASGNLILVGSFAGTLDFCNEQKRASGESDVFVAKFDRDRNCTWFRTFGDDGRDLLIAAALDPEGDVLFTADCRGTVELGNDVTLESGTERGRAIAKLSAADGYAIWGRELYNMDLDDIDGLRPRNGLASDSEGNVLWAARAPRDVPLEFQYRTVGEPWWDAVLVKFDARHGEILWSKRFGKETDVAMLTAIVVDPGGDLIVAGQYLNDLHFDDDELFFGSLSRWNGFLARLSPDGETYEWRKRLDMDLQTSSGLRRSSGLSLALAQSGNLIVAGGFVGALRFGDPVTSKAGLEDIMLAGVDAATGDPSWVQTFGSAREDQFGDLAVDRQGRIAVSGAFYDAIDFGEGSLVAEPGWPDVFVATFEEDGSLRWAQRWGGEGPDHAEHFAVGLRDDLFATAGFTPPFSIGDTLLSETEGDSAVVIELEP